MPLYLKFVLLSLIIHFALFYNDFAVFHKIDNENSRVNNRPIREIKIKLLKDTPRKEYKKQRPKNYQEKYQSTRPIVKKTPQLSQLGVRAGDTKSIAKLQPLKGGDYRNKCLVDIFKSIGYYPDPFFHHRIQGYASIKVGFHKDMIILNEVDTSHYIINSYLCKTLIRTLKRESECIKSLGEAKSVDFKLKLRLGSTQKVNFVANDNGKFVKEVIRLAKSSVARVPMAIANLFTLLELYESDEDAANWETLKMRLRNVNCQRKIIRY